ncbi:MAG: IS110 family transposase, partial [Planctomycetes bacterium]|nr:IS110 family transposase [Planctomycetota bacterium]
MDPKLLSPIHHRDAASQSDLALLRSRDALVAARTKLINHARGSVKSTGDRLSACSTGAFSTRVADELPEELRAALAPVVDQVTSLTKQIREFDRVVLDLTLNKYPHAARLATVPGVGALTALAYVLTIEDPQRFS